MSDDYVQMEQEDLVFQEQLNQLLMQNNFEAFLQFVKQNEEFYDFFLSSQCMAQQGGSMAMINFGQQGQVRPPPSNGMVQVNPGGLNRSMAPVNFGQVAGSLLPVNLGNMINQRTVNLPGQQSPYTVNVPMPNLYTVNVPIQNNFYNLPNQSLPPSTKIPINSPGVMNGPSMGPIRVGQYQGTMNNPPKIQLTGTAKPPGTIKLPLK